MSAPLGTWRVAADDVWARDCEVSLDECRVRLSYYDSCRGARSVDPTAGATFSESELPLVIAALQEAQRRLRNG